MNSAVGFALITIGIYFLPLALLVLAGLQWSRDKGSAVLLFLSAAVFGYLANTIGLDRWLTYGLDTVQNRALFGSTLALAALALLIRRAVIWRKAGKVAPVGIFETLLSWLVVVLCIAALAALPALGRWAESLGAL